LANMNPDTNSINQNAIKLLGRTPRTPFSVITSCPDGSPQVLLADPVFLEDGIWKPFPAFLWLVCPRLKRLVADVEQQGLIKEFSRRLEEDEKFRLDFFAGQKHVSAIRIEMAGKIYPGILPEHIVEILTETTIAGSKDFRGVKCLHSHVAHELAYGMNSIGAETLKIIGKCSSSDICGNMPDERTSL